MFSVMSVWQSAILQNYQSLNHNEIHYKFATNPTFDYWFIMVNILETYLPTGNWLVIFKKLEFINDINVNNLNGKSRTLTVSANVGTNFFGIGYKQVHEKLFNDNLYIIKLDSQYELYDQQINSVSHTNNKQHNGI